MRRLLAVICLSVLPLLALAQVREDIVFINEDGRRHVAYTTLRSNYSTFWVGVNKQLNKEKALENYLYIFPNKFTFDTTSDPERNRIQFPSGQYSTLKQDEWKEQVSVDEDGVYTYSNWDGKKKYSDGHYGDYMASGNFAQLAKAWVLPDSMELVSYESNRNGEWVQRGNTIAFFAAGVNDVTYKIRYRSKAATTHGALSAAFGNEQGVELEQDAAGVKVTLSDTVLFASGSAELSVVGADLVKRVAQTVADKNLFVIAAGHTDNVPVSDALSKSYPTNWELSSARALAVVRQLAASGLPQDRLEARAYGEGRPVAPNNTSEGRAKNRRIEILLQSR